jgi:hypothetical protein
MALQTMRFVFVLVAGPAISRFVAARVPGPRAGAPLEPAEAVDETLEQVREDEGELD